MGIHMVFFFKLAIFAFGTCHEISYNFFFLFSDRQRRIYIYILTAPIKKCGHSTQEGDKLQLLWLILSIGHMANPKFRFSKGLLLFASPEVLICWTRC